MTKHNSKLNPKIKSKEDMKQSIESCHPSTVVTSDMSGLGWMQVAAAAEAMSQ